MGISPAFGEISKGPVESVGSLLLAFHAFHSTGISTALILQCSLRLALRTSLRPWLAARLELQLARLRCPRQAPTGGRLRCASASRDAAMCEAARAGMPVTFGIEGVEIVLLRSHLAGH